MHGCFKFLHQERLEIAVLEERYPPEVFKSKYVIPDYLEIQSEEEIDYMMDYLAVTKRAKSKKSAGKMKQIDFVKAVIYDNLKSLKEDYIFEIIKSESN